MADPCTCETCADTRAELLQENGRLKWWLRHIREIARCSEGVEFYAFLADEALSGRPAMDDGYDGW